MRVLAALAVFLGLAACAAPPAPPADALLRDDLFAAPSEAMDAAEIFAPSDAMRRYVRDHMAGRLRSHGLEEQLLEALYDDRQLRLEYDSMVTRNAAQAFAARAGNCLSLVIMTAAFAKELGLTVTYQSAYLEQSWSRSGNLLVVSGHVNLTLARNKGNWQSYGQTDDLTVDFLPPEEIRGLRTRRIEERTIVAMFMNNRAAETLTAGRLDDAYGWARAAIRHDAGFLDAYNTLGVIYMRRGAYTEAARVFEHVLALEPERAQALSNFTDVLARLGRFEEAAAMRRRLAQVEPHPPYHHFNRGIAAMKRRDYQAARDLFARELDRGSTDHAVHYWLGLANLQLGDIDEARKHIGIALESNAGPGERGRYAAKLSALRTRDPQ